MKEMLPQGWRERLPTLVEALRQGYLHVFGIPDYRRYLAHMAAHHPDKAPLSREQFARQTIDHRYGRAGPRCC